VEVTMARDPRRARAHGATCTVLVELRDGDQIAVTAVGDWPYAAIQRAAVKARRQLDSKAAACTR